MANSSENIKNYSITLLCIIASAFIIFLGFYLKTTAENKAIAQKEILTKVEQKVDSVYNDYKSLIDRQIFMQERIEENANSAGVLLNEGSLIFSLRKPSSFIFIFRKLPGGSCWIPSCIVFGNEIYPYLKY